MKLNAHDNSFETNTQVESQDFSIGDASIIIDILRNRMYQHKVRSICQEIMCNGRDANREVKATKRMIVSVPNELAPVFKVRDFGPGITPNRMAEVFIKYGSSTKRKTNGQTGGFGIGGKSPFAYTDSFTIISITGGVKRTYVAHIGVNNQGRLDLLSSINTDEETGVEINIAVKPSDCYEFRKSVLRACYFWDESERPEFRGIGANHVFMWHKRGLMIGKELELNPIPVPDYIGCQQYDNTAIAVIDGIPYPVVSELVEKVPNLNSLLERLASKAIFHIGNGVLEVGADRERISNDSGGTTTQALEKLAMDGINGLSKHVTAIFKAAKTNAEWIKAFKDLSKIANIDDYSKFGDYKINRGMIESDEFAKIEISHVSLKSKRRSNARNLIREPGRFIGLGNVDQVFVLDTGEPMVTQNKRLREYLEKSNLSSVILINAKEIYERDPNWTRPVHVPGTPPVAPKMLTKTSLAVSKKTLAKIETDFSARGLSCLPYTPTVRIPKAKRDRTKEMFTMHQCNGNGKTPNTTTVEKINADAHYTYLYVPFKQWRQYETELNDLAEYLKAQQIIACGMTEDSISMVAGCKYFKAYETWKINFKAGASLLNAMKSSKAKNTKLMVFLNRSNKTIKDKHISAMMSEYGTFMRKDLGTVPETLMKWAKAELSQFITDDEKLTKLFKDEYSLVSAVEGNDWRISVAQIDELIYYINTKM